MKKVVYFLFVLMSMALVSCDESTTEPDDNTVTTGSISISSNPVGAQIWIDGANSNKVTPSTLTDQDPGQITVSLFLDGYRDTVVTTNIEAGKTVSVSVELTSDASLVTYNNVTIYESDDPSSSHPSGLDLSAGTALSIANSSSNTGKANVDIYYSSNGYVVASASLSTYMTRQTYFYVGASSNMNDHVAAPSFTTSGNWVTSIPDNTSNYVFAYDADGHYSKLKLSSLAADPNSHVNVSWIYNKAAGDKRF